MPHPEIRKLVADTAIARERSPLPCSIAEYLLIPTDLMDVRFI